jgi:hypothetical protein
LKRKHQAEIALNLERSRSGEQFRILDRAKLPTKPSKPSMRKLFVMIVGLSLASGAGLVLVLEYLDTSFKNMDEATEFLGLPLLASLPLLEQKRSRTKIFFNNAMTMLSVGAIMGIFGILAIMSIKGVDPTLAFFRTLPLVQSGV